MLPNILVPALDDGYIDDRDISLGVYMIINKYPLSKNGDYIKVFWGKESFVKTIADAKTDFPVIIKVDDSILTDGYTELFYEVTDVAGNYNISSTIDVLVCRDCSIPDIDFPPLNIKDAELDGFINKLEVDNNSGVILYINKNNKFNISDKVVIEWQERYPNGAPVLGTHVSNEIEIKSNHLENGVSVTIPREKVYLAESGTMWCSYKLLTKQGDVHFSSTTTAAFLFNDGGGIPAPIINHKNENDVLPMSVILEQHGADITIPMSDVLKVGSTVNIYWSGYNNNGGEIPPAKVNLEIKYTDGGDIHVKVPIRYLSWISDGTCDVYYTVNYDKEILTSPKDSAIITFNSDCRLVSLDIDGLRGDKLESSTIDKNNGVMISVSGEHLIKGDVLHIYSEGYDATNILVGGTSFSTTYIIENSSQSIKVPILIPSQYYIENDEITYNLGAYLAAEDYCGAFSYFNIQNSSGGVHGDLLASTGYYSWGGGTLQQSYVHCMHRKPNAELVLDITGNAYFSANGTAHIKSTTDENGSLKLSLSSAKSGVNEISVIDDGGNVSKVTLGAYDMPSLNSPWLELISLPSATSQYYSFYARMNHGDNKCMLITSNGEFYINNEARGAILYDYDLIEGADMQFYLLVTGGFTVSLCDSVGQPYCTYTM